MIKIGPEFNIGDKVYVKLLNDEYIKILAKAIIINYSAIMGLYKVSYEANYPYLKLDYFSYNCLIKREDPDTIFKNLLKYI